MRAERKISSYTLIINYTGRIRLLLLALSQLLNQANSYLSSKPIDKITFFSPVNTSHFLGYPQAELITLPALCSYFVSTAMF